MTKNTRNKRNTVAVILAVIILILGIFAVGGSFWMQEHEIASGAQEYESMSESLKPDAETEQIRADEPDEIEKPTGDDLTVENEDTSETELENSGAEIPGADIPMILPLIQELPLDDNTDLNMNTDNQPATGNTVTNTTVADEPVNQVEQSITTGMTGADLAACKAMNKDFVGWLQIPGTDVDYPVVLTNDVDYYLDHTFTGTENVIGCLFSLDKTDYQAPSKNIAVYGHHMRRSRATTMFQPLHNYKDSSFYATHKTINYDTLYGSDSYTVFAVINKRECDWDVSTADFNSDADFQAFIDRAVEWSLYDTGVTVTAGDHILTLLTCDRDYNAEDGQLVVMAVKN